MFVNLADIANRVRKTFDEDKKSDDSRLFDRIKTCELLVIDDLGTEKVSEWIEEQLFSIVNYRYENQLPMIITSNSKIADLKYNTRIISRLYEMSDQIAFTSLLDRRLKS
jgi:DNA replication protein DnaC